MPIAGVPYPAYFPNRAELHWSIWYPPQQGEEDAIRELEEYVLAACQLDPWLREHPPQFDWPLRYRTMETPWEHPLPQAMVRAWEAVTGERGRRRARSIRPTSAPRWRGRGCSRPGIPSIVFGPGDLRVAHGKDEYVSLDEVVAAAKGLAAARWSGATSTRATVLRRSAMADWIQTGSSIIFLPYTLEQALAGLAAGGLRERRDRSRQGLPRAPRSRRITDEAIAMPPAARRERSHVRLDERPRAAPHGRGSGG